ncbi:MAG TPA: hypothetical protein VFO67_11775, partial [Gemmatimonadales bacterium]|nr:hypothetical protein [Gemmatimonadales bacterium]
MRARNMCVIGVLLATAWVAALRSREVSPTVEVSPTTIDVGEVFQGQVIEGSFKVWNRGQHALSLDVTPRTCGLEVEGISTRPAT